MCRIVCGSQLYVSVRPDRDLTGKQKVPRLRKRQIDEELLNHMVILMNIEAKVVKGDTASTANENISSKNVSLRELFEQKPILDGRRTEVALVKSCYSPLTIFNFSARTAQNTKNPDILCLCSFSYVPRKLPPEFNQTNHLSDNLIDRTLNELVQVVSELRDRVQDMLFQVVKELHPVYSASSRFGNLLLLLPTIMTLSGIMCENLQFVQAFGGRHTGDHLLGEMFGDCLIVINEMWKYFQSISPPLTQSRVSSTICRKSDCGTQTDFDDHLCAALSCGSFTKPFTSPSHVRRIFIFITILKSIGYL
uniref:NR LBD domain-containing protein n=1 Tax=Parascaris equorum TaxID=6256 RepID=A0A914RCS1_PAREQ